MDTTWVDQFLAKLTAASDNILKVDIGGTTIKAEISDDLKQFFLENKSLLVRVGKEAFGNFLFLIHQNKDEQAFMILLAKMDADELIAALKQEASEMAAYNALMEKFISQVKKLLVSTGLRLASKALLALLL